MIEKHNDMPPGHLHHIPVPTSLSIESMMFVDHNQATSANSLINSHMETA